MSVSLESTRAHEILDEVRTHGTVVDITREGLVIARIIGPRVYNRVVMKKASVEGIRKSIAKVRPKTRLKKGEPAFFRWFGAIQVGPGSIEDDIEATRRSRPARRR